LELEDVLEAIRSRRNDSIMPKQRTAISTLAAASLAISDAIPGSTAEFCSDGVFADHRRPLRH